MATEAVPGMADRLRGTLKRRAGGRREAINRINKLSVAEIYAAAPADAVDHVVQASPADPSDFDEWATYRDAAEHHLGPKVVNEWVKEIQKRHDVGPKRRRACVHS